VNVVSGKILERGVRDQTEREASAAARIFGLMGEAESAQFNASWREFDDRVTPEARLARTLDRLQPFLHNHCTEGEVWRKNAIKASQVRQAMRVVGEGSIALGHLTDRLIDCGLY
jgi:putative hydrolase of HD superfamily